MKIKDGLVVEELADGGLLIVDEGTKTSHALKPAAAAAWRSIESGARDAQAIAEETGQELDAVTAALSELHGAGLLELPPGATRRQMLARAATVAGAAAGLKLVESIATPAPAQAQSIRTDEVSDGDG